MLCPQIDVLSRYEAEIKSGVAFIWIQTAGDNLVDRYHRDSLSQFYPGPTLKVGSYFLAPFEKSSRFRNAWRFTFGPDPHSRQRRSSHARGAAPQANGVAKR